jgi:hypothetical protein
MRLAAILIIAGLLGSAAPAARAQGVAPAAEDGRFTLHPTDDGFLRLDGRSGQIASCVRRAGGWSCQAVPGDRRPIAAEARLRAPRVPALQRLRTAIETVWQRVVVMVADARSGLKGRT